MRILAVSVAPLFSSFVMGGSQRILIQVVDALAEAGHEVRVLCADSGEPFETTHGAVIDPILELRGSFPAPYQTSPHRLTASWQALRSAAGSSDRAYLHADAVYMRSALEDLPVVRSLHDFVYEEALLSAFTLPANRTIVPSLYLKDCIEVSTGSVSTDDEVVVVPNGIESSEWPVEPRLPATLEPRQSGDVILLHPHRMQPEKGIAESMRIAVALQHRMPDRRVRLLVPALNPDSKHDSAALVAEQVQEMARWTGAGELVELHEWLGPDRMSGYFAAGDVTLCPGRFVEAFGLSPIESVAAGTPAVCARVGALRERGGLPGIHQFDYGDLDGAVDAVVAAMDERRDRRSDAAVIRERFDSTVMRRSYVDAITGPLQAKQSAGRHSATVGWKLAPWCYVSGDRIYHDYRADFLRFPKLSTALALPGTVIAEDLLGQNAIGNEFRTARENGFIVRV